MKKSLRQQGIEFAPFPVSPSGGKPGAPPPPLRYGSGKAPAQSRTLSAFWAGKEVRFNLDGASPRSPLIYFCMANRTNHLLIKPDILTCYQQRATAYPDSAWFWSGCLARSVPLGRN